MKNTNEKTNQLSDNIFPEIGDFVKIKNDVNLISFSNIKEQSLEVVGTKKGTISVPEFLLVKDNKGDIISVNPNYINKAS